MNDEIAILNDTNDEYYSGFSIQLKSGETKAADLFGRLIAIPEGQEVLLKIEKSASGVINPPRDFLFTPDRVADGSSSNLVTALKSANFHVYIQRSFGGGSSLFFYGYKAWATFSEGGFDFGSFLPLMMEANKVYKVSVNPLDPEEQGMRGTFYGDPRWVDVLPDQHADNSSGAADSIEVGGYRVSPIGGLGSCERYIRLKSAAPLGARPIVFRTEDGKGGLVNIERV